jgi:hypothetical protein
MRGLLYSYAAFTLSLSATAASAQQQGPYCQAGFDALGRYSGPPDPGIVYRTCTPGDSIVLPGIAVLAAQVCDFNKSIIVVSGSAIGTSITFIIAPPRGIRSNR